MAAYTTSLGISELDPFGSAELLNWAGDLFEVYNLDAELGRRNQNISMHQMFKDLMTFSDAGHIVLEGGDTVRVDANSRSVSMVGGTAKASGAYLEVFGDSHATTPGQVEARIKGTGSFKVTTTVFGSTTPTTVVAVNSSGTVAITQGTITADHPAIDASVTWNNVATTFTGWKLNVTDSAAATASMLLDIQYNSATMLNLRKDGRLVLAGRASFLTTSSIGHGFAVSDTNTVSSVIVAALTHNLSSGTPAAGMGIHFDWNIDSTTTASTRAARWTTAWTNATHATRSATTTINTFVSGTESPHLVIGGNQIGGPVGTALLPSWVNRNDTTTGIWYPAASTIAWSLGAVEAMRLDSTGLGIGRAATVNLDIYTTTTVTSALIETSTAGISYIEFKNSNGRFLVGKARTTSNGGLIGGGLVNAGVITTVGAQPLQFGTAGGARMTILGSGTMGVGIGTDSPDGILHVASSVSGAAQFLYEQACDTIDGADIVFQKARGSVGAGNRTTIFTGDELGGFFWQGHDGTTYRNAAGVRVKTTGTIATNQIPGVMILSTSTSGGVLTDRMTLDQQARVGLGPSLTPCSNLCVNNSTTATVSNFYETTDGLASPVDYRRFTITTQAGNTLLRTEAGGTGASALSGLPRILQVGTGPSVGADINGQNVIWHSGAGTGSGTGGSHLFQVSAPGASASTERALATRLTLNTTDLTIATAVRLAVASGTNQRAGDATLVGGTVTVSNTTVTANTRVFVTRKTAGGTIGFAVTYTVSAGTSFTLTSDNVLDTSVYSYILIEVP